MVQARRMMVAVLMLGVPGLAAAAMRPDLPRLTRHLAHPHSWVAAVGADRAIAEFAASAFWCVAVWLLLAGLATIWTARTGRERGLLPALAGSLPRQVRQALLSGLGLSLCLSPGTTALAAPAHSALALTASHPAGPALVPSAPAATLPAIGWPTDPASPPQPKPVPAPTWPLSQPAPTRSANPSPSPTPTSSDPSRPRHAAPSPAAPRTSTPSGTARTTASGPATSGPKTSGPKTTTPAISRPPGSGSGPASSGPNPGPGASPGRGEQSVVVRPGDSLWDIAARQLGPNSGDDRIAVLWPHWYAANRQVIGDDPSLIRPGQHLVAPRNPDPSES